MNYIRAVDILPQELIEQLLAEKYFLAKKSIERIIRREKLKRINSM